MSPPDDHPIVHVLNDKQISRKLRRSLEEAEREETVGIEDAYAYWMYRVKGKSTGSTLGQIALPAGIGALVGSFIARMLTREHKTSPASSSDRKQNVGRTHDSGSTGRSASKGKRLGKTAESRTTESSSVVK